MRTIVRCCFALLLWGCATSSPGIDSRLVGEWRYADPMQKCQYVFARDGTFHGEVAIGGRTVSQFRGIWNVSDMRLLYRYTGDALGKIPAGATDEDKLLAVSDDAFVIEAGDGSQRRYERVKKK